MKTAVFCVEMDDDIAEALAHSASCALTRSSIDLLVADGYRFFNFAGEGFAGYLWNMPDAVLVERSVLFTKMNLACPVCSGRGMFTVAQLNGSFAICILCEECSGKGTKL